MYEPTTITVSLNPMEFMWMTKYESDIFATIFVLTNTTCTFRARLINLYADFV